MTPEPDLSVPCCHCGHDQDLHDPVATRYCAVTLEAALPRSCVCAVGPDTRARSYDHR